MKVYKYWILFFLGGGGDVNVSLMLILALLWCYYKFIFLSKIPVLFFHDSSSLCKWAQNKIIYAIEPLVATLRLHHVLLAHFQMYNTAAIQYHFLKYLY